MTNLSVEQMVADVMRTNAIIQEIRGKFPEVPFPDIRKETAMYLDLEGNLQRSRYNMVIGNLDGEDLVYGATSEAYKVVPHELMVAKVMDSIPEVEGWGKPVFRPVLYKEGSRFRFQADFPDCEWKFKTTKGREVPVSPRLTFQNSYDQFLKFRIEFGGQEQVCKNGMVAFKIQHTVSKRHIDSLDIDAQMEKIGVGIQAYAEQKGIWEAWARTEIPAPVVEEILIAMPFGKKHKDELLQLPQIGTQETLASWMTSGSVNAFDLHGMFTQFLTHQVESEMVKVEKMEKVEKTFHQMFAKMN